VWLRRRRNGLSTGLYDYNQHLDRHHADRNTDTNADPGTDTDTYPNANSPADTHANSHADPRSASSDACGSDDDIDV
jgi:hypothetical protein